MEAELNAILGEKTDSLPRYIAVEGPIGVGKTTLSKRLAASLNYDLLLEEPEQNPFLERFYQDRRQAALPTQLFFLFQRAKQMQEIRQADMFEPVRVADFLMEKDQLFARTNLDDDEYRLYQMVYEHLTINAPSPDLVIYLQAPTEVLMKRIQNRGISSEQLINYDYLETLNTAYTQFFHYYDSSPLIIINTTDIDLVNNNDDYYSLVKYILNIRSGRHYFNPTPVSV